MAKDPAFLFYPGDASNDTQFMNRLERGAYFDLLKAQRLFRGYTVVQARKILGSDFDTVWPSMELVLEREGDEFFIGWLRESIEKREAFSKKQSDRVKERWNNRGNTVVLPKKESENENEIVTEVKIVKSPIEPKKDFDIPEGFPFPSDEAKQALRDYVAHRRQLRCKPYTAIGWKQALKEWNSWGEASWIESVYHTIKKNYQAILSPSEINKSNGYKNQQPGSPQRTTGRVEPAPHGTPFGAF